MNKYTVLALWVITATVVRNTDATPPSFQGLGDFPGGNEGSEAFGISADGTVIVGRGNLGAITWDFFAQGTAFMWTEAGGMQALPTLGGTGKGAALGASHDGSAIVGWMDSEDGPVAFRWTPTGGTVALGYLPGDPFISNAWGISNDGQVVVGGSASSPDQGEAFRWDASTGMVGLGNLPGGIGSSGALAISADGTVVVGASPSTESGWMNASFRWTNALGMTPLGDLPGGEFSGLAYGVSTNGEYIVGQSSAEDGCYAYRWSEASGMVSLGDFPGGATESSAKDVSADGAVVVGFGMTNVAPRAMIWDETHGMQLVETVLTDLGIDLTGWELRTVEGVSDDGRSIVGTGTHDGIREGWYAHLGGAAPCPADVDESGAVDVTDLLAVLGAWGACGGCSEDTNGDDVVDITDLLAVLGNWGPCE